MAATPTVTVRELTEDYCEFQLSGVEAAFANALRRVMIAEVRERMGWKRVGGGAGEGRASTGECGRRRAPASAGTGRATLCGRPAEPLLPLAPWPMPRL